MSVDLDAPTMRPLTLDPKLLEGLVVAVGSACGTKYELLWRCSEFGGLCSLRHW